MEDFEGPTIPAVYLFELDNGQQVQLQSYAFKLAGAFWKGDRISVPGLMFANHVLIASTEEGVSYKQ